jgi:hypothetical protein
MEQYTGFSAQASLVTIGLWAISAQILSPRADRGWQNGSIHE